MDFAIAMLAFTVTLAFYFAYTSNYQGQEKKLTETMIYDARTLSSSLVLGGFPGSWDSSNVVRIGIAEEQKLNTTKLKRFKSLNYTKTKSLFGTTYDYFVFFENENGQVVNMKGVCGVGNPSIQTSYNSKSAYYYSDISKSFMKENTRLNMESDIYYALDPDPIYNLNGLISNISKYDLIILENPNVGLADFNNFRTQFENYSSFGGKVMISGQLSTPNTQSILKMDFLTNSGPSVNATVNNTDQHLDLGIGQNITFSQRYYVSNNSLKEDLLTMASFIDDNTKAISRWKYGNGTVYFFSDFDASYYDGNFSEIVFDSMSGILDGTCSDINVSSVEYSYLVKTERYLNYNSKLARMKVYIWR